jgi:transposase
MLAEVQILLWQRETEAVGMLLAGATVREVADAIKRSERAVRDLRVKYCQTGSVQDKPRSGRPNILIIKAVEKDYLWKSSRYSKDQVIYLS